MTQVITNLLSNALKFTPENGKITVRASVIDNGITVAVSDTGIGIPKDKQNQLFMKFSQITRPTADYASRNQSAPTLGPVPAGTGLGLYITKGIVEAHGGTVSVESEINQGTTISFTIPITDKIVASMGKKPLPSQASLASVSHSASHLPDDMYHAQI
jgi:signal transduction histidine kinase